MWTILLLIVSNAFMTFAWYGHLGDKYRAWPLWVVVLGSWGIAFFEYCFQVPANRIGFNAGFSGTQLKTIQEIITLCVFAAFSVLWMKQPFKWNYAVGFTLIAAGGFFVFKKW